MATSNDTKANSGAIKIISGAIHGFQGIPIEVEVDATNGVHTFNLVGLPDKSVEESKDRIGSAIKNCGLTPPHHTTKRIIVNLAPAHIKKEGPAFDLAIALGFLAVTKQIQLPPADAVFLGELSLDGSLKSVRGALSIAIAVQKAGYKKLFLPLADAKEAALVENIEVFGVPHLKNLLFHLIDRYPISPTPNITHSSLNNIPTNDNKDALEENDIAFIQGNKMAKRALLIAACGGHNIILHGPPGSGKSMLARSLPTILPSLNYEEALEVTQLYSIAGQSKSSNRLATDRPFRKPHHTASAIAITGGGTVPKPGEISLAHNGVLFLDELPEYQRPVIEALRQPLEEGTISISRIHQSITYPAKFQLIAAMNPCPCGMFGSPNGGCMCSAQLIQKYQRKISGPLMDRIDLHVSVPYENINLDSSNDSKSLSSSSAGYRLIVERVRNLQSKRKGTTNNFLNAYIHPSEIETLCARDKEAETLLQSALAKNFISRRGYHKLLKIARTIADIDSSDKISKLHLAEALSYRSQIKNV